MARLGKYAAADRETLQLLLCAWCLLVEGGARARGADHKEIERQLLFSQDSGLWKKWKAKHLMDGTFKAKAARAVDVGWAPQYLSDMFVNAYCKRMGSIAPLEAVNDSDIKELVNSLREYAQKENLKELLDHCQKMYWYVNASDVNMLLTHPEWPLREFPPAKIMVENRLMDEYVKEKLYGLADEVYKTWFCDDPLLVIEAVLARLIKERVAEI